MKSIKKLLSNKKTGPAWAVLAGHLAVSVLLQLLTVTVNAATTPTDPLLGESIQFISNNRLFAVDLETTIFKPEGSGPFPVVVINHGKDFGPNRLQSRARYLPATREFLQRGYVVVVPMRQGFANSGGAAVGEGCNIAGNGNAQAGDIRAVVSWIEKQPWADTTRMVMMGQSHGGLTTLSYAQEPHPGFKVFVNFAGGLKYNNSCLWESALKDAYETYGERTKVASLWFYGENDSFFPPQVIQPAFQAYVKAGGRAELVAYGSFGVDSHAMFGSIAGLPIWWPKVELRLQAASLPTAIIYPQYARKKSTDTPPPSGFAAIEDIARVPNLNDAGRNAYEVFLTKTAPRGFALGPAGVFGWAAGGEEPFTKALNTCSQRANTSCKLYAVDGDVVWKVDK